MGEMAESLLFSSQRVVPQVLLSTGFRFANDSLSQTLGQLIAGK